MDASENDLRYQTKGYGENDQQGDGYGTSIRLKVPACSAAVSSRVINEYDNAGDKEDLHDDDDEELEQEEDEMGEEVAKTNGVRVIGKDSYDDEDEDSDDEVEVEDEDDDDDNDDNGFGGKPYNGNMGNNGTERPQKKRKFKSLVSNYEFAPRVRASPAHVDVKIESSYVGPDVGVNWTDLETFALLDAWGDRFLKLGRKSLSYEEWQDVVGKVSKETSIERSVSQCRTRLDSLKKKYRKEKLRASASAGGVSNWVFFRKMDMLLCSPSQCTGSLSCGIDSGEYVFMNPKAYLNRANGLDEMRDSPGNSASSRDNKDGSNGIPPNGKRKKGKTGNRSSFRSLADSIEKFSELYEDIENNKRKEMLDLENMRMDIQRQIEMQMREILERAQAEIVKIREDGDHENDISADNGSG